MKLLLPSETKVECNIKTLKAFENYINLINDSDIAIAKFIAIGKLQLSIKQKPLKIYPCSYWDEKAFCWKIASSDNLKNRIREFEELMKDE